jgi:hypothetical protein
MSSDITKNLKTLLTPKILDYDLNQFITHFGILTSHATNPSSATGSAISGCLQLRRRWLLDSSAVVGRLDRRRRRRQAGSAAMAAWWLPTTLLAVSACWLGRGASGG